MAAVSYNGEDGWWGNGLEALLFSEVCSFLKTCNQLFLLSIFCADRSDMYGLAMLPLTQTPSFQSSCCNSYCVLRVKLLSGENLDPKQFLCTTSLGSILHYGEIKANHKFYFRSFLDSIFDYAAAVRNTTVQDGTFFRTICRTRTGNCMAGCPYF